MLVLKLPLQILDASKYATLDAGQILDPHQEGVAVVQLTGLKDVRKP
jgi:hypothetical protein